MVEASMAFFIPLGSQQNATTLTPGIQLTSIAVDHKLPQTLQDFHPECHIFCR